MVALHRDVLKLLRCYIQAKYECDHPDEEVLWHVVEQEVVHKYGEWIQRQRKAYPTTVEDDEAILKNAEDNKQLFHWMY